MKWYVGAIRAVLNEGAPLPDLIIVDGGKGHMSGVIDVLENELGLDIPVSGLRKNDKHQTSEILYGESAEIVPLKKTAKHFICYKGYKMKCIDLLLLFIDKHAKKQVCNQY
ncbi:hypothetical protein ABLV92_03640 [Staphylococcus equorum]